MTYGRILIFDKERDVLTKSDLKKVVKSIEEIKCDDPMFKGFRDVVIFDGRVYVGYDTDSYGIIGKLDSEIIRRGGDNGFKLNKYTSVN